MNQGESLESWKERAERLREKHGNGNGAGMPIGIAVQQWGTPQAHDQHPGDARRVGRYNGGGVRNPNDEAALWATRGGDRSDEEGLDRQVKRHDTSYQRRLPGETSEDYWERMERHEKEHGITKEDLADGLPPWPTPSAGDSERGNREEMLFQDAKRGDDLRTAADRWPSPRAEDGECAGAHRGAPDSLHSATRNWPSPKSAPSGADFARANREGSGSDDLATAVAKQNWPTAAARDYRSPNAKPYRERGGGSKGGQLVNALAHNGGKGQLNPDWEEVLQGWPVGWTDAERPCAGIWPGWPAPQGPLQFDYEPPRLVAKGACPHRVARVKCIGNGVVPQCAEEAFVMLLSALAPEVAR